MTVEIRGGSAKKKLEVEATEADMVRRIFGLFLNGENTGPMGVRAIAKHLDGLGLTYRKGCRFGSSLVHAILTNTTYKRQHYFNRKTLRTGKRKDKADWDLSGCPVIIEATAFDRVQAILKQRRPRVTPARETNGPTLLTGRVKCAHGSGMTLRSGKGGKYRYYTCQKHANEGGCDCRRHSIPMATLDTIVLDQLEARIFAPDRLKELLARVLDHASDQQSDARAHVADLNRRRREVEIKLDRLYTDRAEGIAKDTDTFRRKAADYEGRLDALNRAIASATATRESPMDLLTPRNLERFATAMRNKLHENSPALRKAYVRHFVERVDVLPDEIRISGSKAALMSVLQNPDTVPMGPVPGSVQEWWCGQSKANWSLAPISLFISEFTGKF
ncbi:MAG: recombinase family protein [Rhodospirillaceae bacterium]|nr:recombinase family protein [Rhodospirillaceae bacterium]